MDNTNNKARLVKLVDAVKSGDSQAFADLYSATYQKSYYFALSLLKNEAAAEDAVQETYLKALTSIGRLRDNARFFSWLNSIVYNTCMDMLAASKKATAVDDDTLDAFDSDDESSDPLLRAVSNDTQRMVMRNIERLTPPLRAVIVLRYYHDMSMNDIARVLDINTGTVKSRLAMAKKKLKNSITMKKEYSILLFLPIAKALASSSAGAQLPADTALGILTSALSDCSMATRVRFTPSSGISGLRSQITRYVSAGAAVVAGTAALTLSATPRLVSLEPVERDYAPQVPFVATFADYPEVDEIHCVSPSGAELEYDFKSGGNSYEFTATENGVYSIVAASPAGRTVTDEIDITNVDYMGPGVVSFSFTGEELSVVLSDDLSGIDYESIYAEIPGVGTVRPDSFDAAASTIVFKTDRTDFVFYVTDKAGNVARNTVTSE